MPFRPPGKPDLPGLRVSDSPPFSNTGLHFAGPLYVKDSSNKKGSSESEPELNKVCVLLLTCAATRAVHLELTRALDVPTFLLAIRRFVAIGLRARFISDNTKTFKQLLRIYEKLFARKKILDMWSAIGSMGIPLWTRLPGEKGFGKDWLKL